MAKCLNCGDEVESKGTKPKLYCSDKCRMVFNRKAKLVANCPVTVNRTEQTNKIEPNISQTNTLKRTKTFADLPEDVRQDIDRITAWCELKGVPDDRQARIQRAIDYDNMFNDQRGLIDIHTLAMVDVACGDKLTHGLEQNAGGLNG